MKLYENFMEVSKKLWNHWAGSKRTTVIEEEQPIVS